MAFAPILNKIIVPRTRVRCIRRDRLLDFLHRSRSHRLIVVSAAAGYGKTSLLSAFASETPATVCWFSIDAQDNEPRQFFSYLVAAIQKRFPDFGKGFERFLTRSRKGAFESEQLIGLLANDLETKSRGRVLIILDDYHHVAASAEISNAVKRLVQQLPVRCSLVVATRVDPDLDLPVYASRRELALLDNEALKLTCEEVETLFHEVYGVQISSDEAVEVVKRTNGWGALVVLEAKLYAKTDERWDCWQSAQVGQIRTREDYYYEELRGSSLRVLL